VARDVAETGILATGQIMVILIAGIDLGVGSVVALTATTTALLLMREQTINIPLIGGIELARLPAEQPFYWFWAGAADWLVERLDLGAFQKSRLL